MIAKKKDVVDVAPVEGGEIPREETPKAEAPKEEKGGYTVEWDGEKKKGLTLEAANDLVARLFGGAAVKKVSLRGVRKNCDYTRDDKGIVTKVAV